MAASLPLRFFLLLLLLAVGIGYYAVVEPSPSESRGEPLLASPGDEFFAVFPFRPEQPAAEGLATGMGTLLEARLSGNGHLWRIPAATLPSEVVDDPSATARRIGARVWITGTVRIESSQVEITAEWQEDGLASTTARAKGALSDLPEILDRLAEELLPERIAAAERRVSRLEAVLSSSFPALRHFLDGEQAWRSGDVPRARERFLVARAEDPLFSLVHLRLALLPSAPDSAADRLSSLQQALLLANRLPLAERKLLEAQLPVLQGDAEEARRRHRELVRQAPAEWTSWLALQDLEPSAEWAGTAADRVRQLAPWAVGARLPPGRDRP